MELDAAQIIALIAGAMLLLLGWLLYNAVLNVVGGVLGGGLGLGLGVVLADAFDVAGGGAVAMVLGSGVVGAVAGVLAFHTLGAISFFVLGAAVGGLVAVQLAPVLHGRFFSGADPDLVLFGGATLAAIVAGLVGFFARKVVVAVGSSAIGSMLIMTGLDWPLGGLPILLLFPAGVAIQLWPRRREGEDEADGES
jgi:hypothetical protein